jgi:hypothetical protein
MLESKALRPPFVPQQVMTKENNLYLHLMNLSTSMSVSQPNSALNLTKNASASSYHFNGFDFIRQDNQLQDMHAERLSSSATTE